MEVTAAEAEEDTEAEVMAEVVTSVYVVSNPRF